MHTIYMYVSKDFSWLLLSWIWAMVVYWLISGIAEPTKLKFNQMLTSDWQVVASSIQIRVPWNMWHQQKQSMTDVWMDDGQIDPLVGFWFACITKIVWLKHQQKNRLWIKWNCAFHLLVCPLHFIKCRSTRSLCWDFSRQLKKNCIR